MNFLYAATRIELFGLRVGVFYQHLQPNCFSWQNFYNFASNAFVFSADDCNCVNFDNSVNCHIRAPPELLDDFAITKVAKFAWNWTEYASCFRVFVFTDNNSRNCRRNRLLNRLLGEFGREFVRQQLSPVDFFLMFPVGFASLTVATMMSPTRAYRFEPPENADKKDFLRTAGCRLLFSRDSC